MPMASRSHRLSRAILVSLIIGMALFLASAMVWSVTAKAAPRPPGAAADTEVSADDLQRSLRLDTY